MIVGKVTKQPVDVQDYDISFVDWLTALGDTADSATATISGSDAVATVFASPTVSSGVVKVWVSGGTSGVTYKVSVTMSSTGGRVKQAELSVKVREV